MSASVRDRGVALEDSLDLYLSSIINDLSQAMCKKLATDFNIDNYEIKDIQQGGRQGGKDRVVILYVRLEGESFPVPIYIESKSNKFKGKPSSPDELEMYKKIWQVAQSQETSIYFQQPYRWFSYMLFLPFSYIANQDFEDTIALATRLNDINFPKHFWSLSNNSSNSSRVLLVGKEYRDSLTSTGYFNAKGHSECLELIAGVSEVENKSQIVDRIADQIIISKQKYEDDFTMIRHHLEKASTQDELDGLMNSNTDKINKGLSVGDVVEANDMSLIKKYKDELESADSLRVDYLIQMLLVHKHGGAFSNKIPEIEEEYYRLTKEADPSMGITIVFAKLEDRIDGMVNSYNGFNRFDHGENLIRDFLFVSENTRIGCFYNLLTLGRNKLELFEESLELRDD